MCLSGQPALKVCLATSTKRVGNEWVWAVTVVLTVATVWDERTCEIAGWRCAKSSLSSLSLRLLRRPC